MTRRRLYKENPQKTLNEDGSKKNDTATVC